MKKLNFALALCSAFAAAGCVSPEITNNAHSNIADAMVKVQSNIRKTDPVQTRAEWELAQEVDAPYIVGKSVPLARNVTLPRALQKGVKTALMFPEQWVSLSTVAERIMLATGLVVTISQDVYLDNNALMRKTAKDGSPAAPASFAAMPTGLAPTPLPSPLGNKSPGTPAALYTSSSGKPSPSANGFDFPRAEAELGQILDLVATKLSINWRYDEASNSIKFYRLVTKSWPTPFSSANSQYTTLLDGTTSASSNANALADKASVAPISSNQKEMNELMAIKESAGSVMTKSGEINANPATGTITITDTAEAVDAADVLIRSEIKILSRLVLLKVQTIQVTVNKSGETAVNLSAAISKALKNLPDLALSIDSPASLTTSNAASLGLNIFSGSAAGSSAVIRALQEIGDVQTSTEIPMATRNRQAIYYNVRNTFSYVSATTAAAATTGGTGGTPGITTAQDSVGLKLMMYPNVTSKDNVMLTMSMDQSILQSLPTFSSGSGASLQSVQLPNVNGEGSSQHVPIRNGQTIVLTGFDRTANQYDKRTLGDGIPVFAGGSLRSSQSRSTTIVLVSVAIRDID